MDTAFLLELLQEHFQLGGALTPLSGENQNFRLDSAAGPRVVKVVRDPGLALRIDVEEEMVHRLAQGMPDVDFPESVPSVTGGAVIAAEDRQGPLWLRVMPMLPGREMDQAHPLEPDSFAALGRLTAQIPLALQGWTPPSLKRNHDWNLARLDQHRNRVLDFQDSRQARLLEQTFFMHAACVMPRLAELAGGVIHGDLNPENLLVDGGRIRGVVDFGDALVNPWICELAVATSYALMLAEGSMGVAAQVVAAHHELRSLSALELELLHPLICGRLANSLVMSHVRRRLDPSRTAWFTTEESAWPLLEQLLAIDPVAAADALGAGIAATVQPFPDRLTDVGDPKQERQRHFADALSLSYRQPLVLSRGRRAWLYDHRERPHLDLYNNVCHVGHAEPKVVAALCAQAARLNTNTRYLHPLMHRYAERLCATLPPELDTVFLVNSGSEANDLAIRIARAHTGRTGLVVIEGAYHGSTTATFAASPYKQATSGPDRWVLPLPSTERAHDSTWSEQLPEPPAALLTETWQSCAGQWLPPKGYLVQLCQEARALGALCIFDEVQTGFGRCGSHFWAFQAEGVIPDLVVLGKPIGNGHPMAAVVTRREIADSFAKQGEYFSTFGGNPVSCAVGLAVLDVIEQEKLVERAASIGELLMVGLRDLQRRHACIGDVRGRGLFLGIALVHAEHPNRPNPEAAYWLVERLREDAILTGVDGLHHNVIKIKPPLVLEAGDAQMFLRRLSDRLREWEARVRSVSVEGDPAEARD